MPQVVLIQSSLNSDSNTAKLIQAAAEMLDAKNISNEIIDLRTIEMQFCDSRKLSEYNSDMQQAHKTIKESQAMVFGMPVYCYSLSGPLKNFIDITAGAMEKKMAAIVCAAGGKASYMASADLEKILAFESHVTTIQPNVYTTYDDYTEDKLTGEKSLQKLRALIDNLAKHLKVNS